MLQNETAGMRGTQMIRLIVAAAVCVLMGGLAGNAVAAPITEAAVEEACGDDVEAGCTKTTCATGCEKIENGKWYSYGCLYPNKTGATKATCSKVPISRRADANSSSAGQATGGVDAGSGNSGSGGAGATTGGFGTRLQKGGTAAQSP